MNNQHLKSMPNGFIYGKIANLLRRSPSDNREIFYAAFLAKHP